MIELDGTETKSRLGANAILGVSLAAAHAAARRGRRSRSTASSAASDAQPAAGADDERAQRRRARRQQRRPPGVHDLPARRAELLRGAALGRGGLPHAQGGAARRRATRRRWATRAASRPNLASNREAIELVADARSRRPATGPARTSSIALDPAASEFYEDGALRARGRGATKSAEEMIDVLGGVGRALPDRLHRGRPRRGRLGRLERAHRAARRAHPDRRRRHLRHQSRDPATRASSEGVANAILIKLNQIGTLTETLEAIRMAREAGYSRRSSRTAPARPRTPHRRPRRRHRLRPDQDGLAVPLGPRLQVQPAAAHRGRSSASAPSTRAQHASRARRVTRGGASRRRSRWRSSCCGLLALRPAR